MNKGCPVKRTTDNQPCGRDPWEEDKRGYCYFHSEEEKDPKIFEDLYMRTISKSFGDDSIERVDFSRSVFPDFSPPAVNFVKPCVFDSAVFTGETSMRETRFREVSFKNVEFMKEVSFKKAQFPDFANFGGAVFHGPADFVQANFANHVNFGGAIFQMVTFVESQLNYGRFDRAKIERGFFNRSEIFGCYFLDSLIKEVTFYGAKASSCAFINSSLGSAVFDRATIRSTNFRGSTIDKGEFRHSTLEDIEFPGVVFEDVSFHDATFEGQSLFSGTHFKGTADFTVSKVNSHLILRDIRVDKTTSLDFRYVGIVEKDGVEFIGQKSALDMSQIRLLHTDVTKIRFWNVKWREGGKVYDDELYGKEHPDKRYNLGNLEALYRDLRRLRNLRARYLSLYGIYWRLSLYGESYKWAGAWIVGSMLFFAVLQMVVAFEDWSDIPSLIWTGFYHSILAFFQLRTETPLDVVERLWAILILALFFLAVRRRFKR
jgi:uncharacterized protein YjbI with pentapeptide repeats